MVQVLENHSDLSPNTLHRVHFLRLKATCLLQTSELQKAIIDLGTDDRFEQRDQEIKLESMLIQAIQHLDRGIERVELVKSSRKEDFTKNKAVLLFDKANIMMAYSSLDDKYLSQSINLFLDSKRLAEVTEDISLNCQCEYNLALLYSKKDQASSAERHLNEYLQLVRKRGEYWQEEIKARQLLTDFLIDEKRFNEALKNIKGAFKVLKVQIYGNRDNNNINRNESPHLKEENIKLAKQTMDELQIIENETFKKQMEYRSFEEELQRFKDFEGKYQRVESSEWAPLFREMIRHDMVDSILDIFSSPQSSNFSVELEVFLETIASLEVNLRLKILNALLDLLICSKNLKPNCIPVFKNMIGLQMQQLRQSEVTEESCEDYCLVLIDYASLLDDLKRPIQDLEVIFQDCIALIIENRSYPAAANLLCTMEIIYKDLGDPTRINTVCSVIEAFKEDPENFEALKFPFHEFENMKRTQPIIIKNEVANNYTRKMEEEELIKPLVATPRLSRVSRPSDNRIAPSTTNRPSITNTRHQSSISHRDSSLYFQKNEWFLSFHMKQLINNFDVSFSEIGDLLLGQLCEQVERRVQVSNKSISTLNLSFCCLTDSFFHNLIDKCPKFMMLLTPSLKLLDLSSNNLDYSSLYSFLNFVEEILQNSNDKLEFINISDINQENGFLVAQKQEISINLRLSNILRNIFEEEVTNPKSLILRGIGIKEVWNLKWTFLDDECTDLKILENKKIENLNMSKNRLEPDSIYFILVLCSYLPSIKVLDLSKQCSIIKNVSYSCFKNIQILISKSTSQALTDSPQITRELNLSGNESFINEITSHNEKDDQGQNVNSRILGILSNTKSINLSNISLPLISNLLSLLLNLNYDIKWKTVKLQKMKNPDQTLLSPTFLEAIIKLWQSNNLKILDLRGTTLSAKEAFKIKNTLLNKHNLTVYL